MSAICPNCKARLSCGCQLKVASDKARVCTQCISAYESALARKKVRSVESTRTEVINNVTNTTPTNMKVMYNPPSKK